MSRAVDDGQWAVGSTPGSDYDDTTWVVAGRGPLTEDDTPVSDESTPRAEDDTPVSDGGRHRDNRLGSEDSTQRDVVVAGRPRSDDD